MGHIPQFLKSMKNSSVFFIFNSRKYKAQCYSKIILTYIIVNIILHIILKYGVGASMRSMFSVQNTDRKSPFLAKICTFCEISSLLTYHISLMTSIRRFIFINLNYKYINLSFSKFQKLVWWFQILAHKITLSYT